MDFDRCGVGVCAGGGIAVSARKLCPDCAERHHAIRSPSCRHRCTPAECARNPRPNPAVLGIDDAGRGFLDVLPVPVDVLRGVAAQGLSKPFRRRRNTVPPYRPHDGGAGCAAACATEPTYHPPGNARLRPVVSLVAISLFVCRDSLAVRATVRAQLRSQPQHPLPDGENSISGWPGRALVSQPGFLENHLRELVWCGADVFAEFLRCKLGNRAKGVLLRQSVRRALGHLHGVDHRYRCSGAPFIRQAGACPCFRRATEYG